MTNIPQKIIKYMNVYEYEGGCTFSDKRFNPSLPDEKAHARLKLIYLDGKLISVKIKNYG